MTIIEKAKSPRKGGQLKGILIIKDNFDEPLPKKLLKSFYGEKHNRDCLIHKIKK